VRRQITGSSPVMTLKCPVMTLKGPVMTLKDPAMTLKPWPRNVCFAISAPMGDRRMMVVDRWTETIQPPAAVRDCPP
jgi:hypothetical protein